MKHILIANAAILALLASSASAQAIALVGGDVADLDGKAPIRDAVVVIEGERIAAIGPRGTTPVPAGATVVPMTGKWLIPGLMNMHVHLALNLPGTRRVYNEGVDSMALRTLDNAHRSLLSGVTTMRLTGSDAGVDFTVKKAIDAGMFDGPRIHTAGASIVPTGGHGRPEVDGPAAFARAVREADLYVEAGMTPAQALRSATIDSARMPGVDKEVGALRRGYLADIVAVDGDPTQDIRALRTIGFVMKGGKVVRNDAR